ncbi:hypothetical protein G6F57_013814 [Rhizopus arrhizus]|nr:hypothetical protein G6F57_013814 [Rhizopus arrhizus]
MWGSGSGPGGMPGNPGLEVVLQAAGDRARAVHRDPGQAVAVAAFDHVEHEAQVVAQVPVAAQRPRFGAATAQVGRTIEVLRAPHLVVAQRHLEGTGLVADILDPREAAGLAVVGAAFAGDEPAEHAVGGHHIAALRTVIEGGAAELALPRQRAAHLRVFQRPLVDVGIAAGGEVDQGQAALVGQMASRARADLQARNAVGTRVVIGFAGQRQTQVQHVTASMLSRL